MKKSLFMAMICLTVIFMVGMLAMDIGVTGQIMEAGNGEVRASSLLLKDVEPRIVYHAGVVVVIMCWLILCSILLWVKV